VAGERFQLRFGVSISDAGFEDQFFEWINRSRLGSFLGNEQASERVRDCLAKYEFDDESSSVPVIPRFLQPVPDW